MTYQEDFKTKARLLIIADRDQDALQAASIHIPQNAENVRTEGPILCFRATTKLNQSVTHPDLYMNQPHRVRIGKPTSELLNKLGIAKF